MNAQSDSGRRWVITGVALCLLAGFAAPGWAADLADPALAVERAQRRREREAHAARELATWIGMSNHQARRLLPILEEAAAVRIQSYEERAAMLDELLDTYSEFAEQDRLNQGFTPEVEQRTGRIHHEEIVLHDTAAARLLELEQQAAEILTSTQREFAAEFHPGRYRRGGFGAPRHGVQAYINAAAARAQREAQHDDLTDARDELHELHKQTHPGPNLLGRRLLHPAAAEPICRLAGFNPTNTMRGAVEVLQHGTPSYPRAPVDRQEAQISRLRTEINNWNLINGMHFTQHQIDRIVSIYESAEPQMYALKSKRGKQTRQQRNALFVNVENAVDRVLNAGQRQVLSEYEACLLPPKNLKDPVRVGQANDGSRYERWLTRARNAPDKRLERLIERGLEAEAKHYGPLSPTEREQRAALLRDTAHEAKALCDVDFQLNKTELAARITPRDRLGELKTEIATLSHARGLPGVIAQFILKPEFVEQLRIRGDQLAAGMARD